MLEAAARRCPPCRAAARFEMPSHCYAVTSLFARRHGSSMLPLPLDATGGFASAVIFSPPASLICQDAVGETLDEDYVRRFRYQRRE